jgi:transposase-like protein
LEKLRAIRLAKAAKLVENGVGETRSYYAMPSEHWRCLRTNIPLERLMCEIRRRTRGVDAFPGAREIAAKWGTKRYLQMERLAEVVAIA